jgi:hypothetical protein
MDIHPQNCERINFCHLGCNSASTLRHPLTERLDEQRVLPTFLIATHGHLILFQPSRCHHSSGKSVLVRSGLREAYENLT